jgi:hypothetical protein
MADIVWVHDVSTSVIGIPLQTCLVVASLDTDEVLGISFTKAVHEMYIGILCIRKMWHLVSLLSHVPNQCE